MELRFWGTRGSIPSPGPRTVRYGGNTPCLEVRSSTGALVIFDAGTGIRELGRSLSERAGSGAISGDIFLSHAHWDHIQGLPFFAPFYDAGNRFRIWSAAELTPTVQRVVREQMAPGVFPVDFNKLKANITFHSLDDDAHEGDGFRMSMIPLRHPGGALGYRLADREGTHDALVYISDNELGESSAYQSAPDWRERLVEFVRGATVLVHDATYTGEEYERYRGWGHSQVSDVVALAVDAGVERLVLYHHNPERSDEDVDANIASAQAMVRAQGASVEVSGAAESMTLVI